MEILFLGVSATAIATAAVIAINLSQAKTMEGNLWSFPTSFPSFVVAACWRRWWWKFPFVEQTTNNNLCMTQFDPIVLFQFDCLKRQSIKCCVNKAVAYMVCHRWLDADFAIIVASSHLFSSWCQFQIKSQEWSARNYIASSVFACRKAEQAGCEKQATHLLQNTASYGRRYSRHQVH